MPPLSRLLALATVLLAATAVNAASAQAAPRWKLEALANSTAAPGSTLDYLVEVRNVGDAPAEGSIQPIVFNGTLPTGLTIQAVQGPFSCPGLSGQTFSCEYTEQIPTQPENQFEFFKKFTVEANVEAGASGLLTAEFEVTGGGAPAAAATVAPATITPEPPAFGIAAFDINSIANPAAAPYTQAAGHPYANTTSMDFNTYKNPEFSRSDLTPVEPTKDIEVETPPGFLGDPLAVGQCTLTQLAQANGLNPDPLCPPSSQVGATTVRINTLIGHDFVGPVPVFNMPAPPDAPAQLGFNFLGVVVTIHLAVRNGTDYGLTARASDISEGLGLAGSTLTLWGDPADPIHTPERSCPGNFYPIDGGPTCASTVLPAAFLREPTSCTEAGEGTLSTLRIDSWFNPGAFAQRTIHSHLLNDYPYPEQDWGAAQGPTGCTSVPFDPGLSAQPTTETADSPSGLDLHITVPQNCWAPEQEGSVCQSDLRDAEVKLPQGMTLNPSAASGLEACTPQQVGVTSEPGETPVTFNQAPASCPNASKIGQVTIETPPLERPLTGAVYMAKQNDNPFNSLLAMYLVAEGSGVVVKQAGEIVSDPNTGRLTTIFREAPQQPFSDLHVQLFGGPRAPLRTPPSCGTFGISAKLTPWSGNASATVGSAFEIEKCPNSGFDPKFSAGTQNPLAGTTSPFSLRLTREDGTQEVSGLTAMLPPGLSGYLKGIAYCPDSVLAAISEEPGTGAAQEASPSCPAASQVGTVTVGAGAGPNPFFTQSGRAYLAGPYKGAPLSIAVVTPAVAGPFDLGNVVVRNALQVNPETAQITSVSDPIPSILHGIPLDLKDIRVELNRPEFTLNPTSCEAMAIGSTITSKQGASANPSVRFQMAGCERLGFKPKLSLRLKGSTKRTGHPALRAVLTMPPANQANIAHAQVALPHSEFLDQGHIGTVCTRVQFAEGNGGGEKCPTASIYGYARAFSPLLEAPLEGPVYLRSSTNKLPDLVAALNGQIDVALDGRIDSINGGIRTTFEVVPDAPVSRFELQMKGAAKGLLVNSEGLCGATHRATALFDAQNGRVRDLEPALKASCGSKAHKKHKRRG